MKVLLFANTDWFLYNFRLALALALRDAGYEVVLVSPDGPYGERIRDSGLRWIVAPMERRSLNPVKELRLFLWLRKLLKDERFDVIHSFTLKCVVYGSLAAKIAGTKGRISGIDGLGYVFSSSDIKARVLRPLVWALMRFALKGRDMRLILLNRDDVKIFRESGFIAESQISLIPGAGVNCTRFSERAVSVIGTPMRVLLAARLLWDKGVNEFVAAARILKSEGRAVSFLIAGSPDVGNPAAVPEGVVKSWVEEGVIQWLGHVDNMAALLSSVDVVALPSYREGLPTSLIEAGACGIPLVTTDAPGCRDVVTHEVDGLLVPVGDSMALARAIARLQDTPVLAERLGAAAKLKVRQQFDEKIIIEKTLKVYEDFRVKEI